MILEKLDLQILSRIRPKRYESLSKTRLLGCTEKKNGFLQLNELILIQLYEEKIVILFQWYTFFARYYTEDFGPGLKMAGSKLL